MSPAKQLHVKDLAPSEHNPRTITGERLEALGRAMREYGDLSGVVYNRRTKRLVGGHQRIKHIPEDAKVIITERHKRPTRTGTVATGTISFDGEEWTYREVSVPASVERMMNLAANAHGGEFDDMLLGATLFDMAKEDDFTLDSALLTGLDPKEVDKLIRSYQESVGSDEDEDPLPEAPAKPKSKLGTVYELGPHRLMCGDATNPDHVDKLLNGDNPHLMVTDPPYGVEYEATWRNEALGEANRAVGVVNNDDRSDWREAWAMFGGDVAYVWHASLHARVVEDGLVQSGFDIRSQIVWCKQHFVISRAHYHPRHEVCWYAVRKGGATHWVGDRKQSTVWHINNLSQGGGRSEDDMATGHSTQKPLEAMRRPILNNSRRGDGVYDPFGGSGTTLIAAEDTGRICYMMEIDPGYCDVIRQRYKNFCARRDGAADGEGEAA